MTDQTNTSAVRDAAALIFAAEDLLDLAVGDDLDRVAAAVDQIARSAKALRAGHLDDALAHVEQRAGWITNERRRWQDGPLRKWDTIPLDVPDPNPWPDGAAADDALARAERHATAVNTLVGTPETADVEALRDRVKGDEG